jgi:glucokinase
MSEAPFTSLGIDVGGTKIAAGIVEFPEGVIHDRHTIATRPERGGERVIEEVAGLARKLAEDSDKRGKPVRGVGLGLCELVDSSGRIMSANCLPWTNEMVEDHLKGVAPITIEADVRAAALAEAQFGAGRGRKIFLYVSVGTGISSCLMIDGAPYLGARGATGTMASSPLAIPCERCGSVNQRTLEQIASGPALVARYNEINPGAVSSGEEVLAAIEMGDPDAPRIVRSASESLESVVALMVNVLDPEAVIIGGGLGLSRGPFWEEFTSSTRRHIWSEIHRDLPLVQAATGRDAGLLGAAAASWKQRTQNFSREA